MYLCVPVFACAYVCLCLHVLCHTLDLKSQRWLAQPPFPVFS